MNMRRLSYGLLISLATTVVACGCDEKPAETPPQPSASPVDTSAPAPSATEAAAPPPATSEPAPPPPPPAKPAKEKFVGKFVQDFAGDVKDTADAAAKKAAGAKDKDGKKYQAALDKAAKAVADTTLENTGDTLTWNVKGKPAHTVTYSVDNSTDTTATLKLAKDGKKDLKGQPLEVTFTDDDHFTVKDPWAKNKDKAQTLVFKRQ